MTESETRLDPAVRGLVVPAAIILGGAVLFVLSVVAWIVLDGAGTVASLWPERVAVPEGVSEPSEAAEVTARVDETNAAGHAQDSRQTGRKPALADPEAGERIRSNPALAALEAARSSDQVQRGLELGFRPLADSLDAPARFARVARTAALYVESGASPVSGLEPGPFQATWRGTLTLKARERLWFRFEGRGRFSLRVDGEVVLEGKRRRVEDPVTETGRLRLGKGAHAVELRYTAPLSGDAVARLVWRGRNFPLEPIPPEVWSFTAAEPALVRDEILGRGRDLAVQNGCMQCHASAPVGGRPARDLAHGAPQVIASGGWLRPAWVAAHVLEPGRFRPGSRMPALLEQGDEGGQQAADLAAYLLQKPSSLMAGQPSAGGPGDAAAGRSHFARYGCVACHALGDDDPGLSPDESTPRHRRVVSLAHVSDKYEVGALASFLANPRGRDEATGTDRNRFGRMPHFALDAVEAHDLEAFLRERYPASLPDLKTPGDVAAGAALYASVGCASCHPGGAVATLEAPSLARVAAAAAVAEPEAGVGCLSTKTGPSPRYDWIGDERLYVQAFLASEAAADRLLVERPEIEFARTQLRVRRCTACHEMDGRQSTWTERRSLAEEAGIVEVLPEAKNETEAEVAGLSQVRPGLTWAGDKLRGPWLEGYLNGSIASVRPWIRAHMPAIDPEIAAPLARGLAFMHGRPFDARPEPAGDPAKVSVGAALVESDGGFGCITCHAIGDRMPAALFEVQGINFRDVAPRLRRGFYERWMLDPSRIHAAAKMPKYADRRGKTGLPALGNNAEAQFDAIWAWLKTLPQD